MNSADENIYMVKRLYTLFAQKDIDSIMQLLTEDIEWGEPENPYNPAGGTRHGHQGFLEWLDIGKKNEEILKLEPRKMLADSDTVAVIGSIECIAIPTGKTYESDFVHVFTIRDGKIRKYQEFFDTYIAGEAFKQ
jgi:ketosteroid isomerase-like protein